MLSRETGSISTTVVNESQLTTFTLNIELNYRQKDYEINLVDVRRNKQKPRILTAEGASVRHSTPYSNLYKQKNPNMGTIKSMAASNMTFEK